MKNKKCKIKKILGSKPRDSNNVEWKLTTLSVIPPNAGIQARADTQVRPYRKNLDAHFTVTPVKTGVHPHPLQMDTVLQRYDGPFPIETFTDLTF
ncbi:MAG: hypothetical protein EXR70_04215 [Deltaproteobacteria bacterium]|nr:hypothetical protein [Deltaproteobacteria bacterium]